MKPVSLKEIADQLDCLMDEWNYYLNKKTGEIVEIQTEYMSVAEELEDDADLSEYLNWEQEAIREAVSVLENWEDYVELPDKEEVNDYRIMKNFCYSQEDEKLRNKLFYAINGRGAFRRFKDLMIQYGLEEDGAAYKYEALCEIAREWCEFHEIQYK